jgi:hypothetical protein
MHCDGLSLEKSEIAAMKFAIAPLNPYYIHIVWKFSFKTASSKIKKTAETTLPQFKTEFLWNVSYT